MFDIGWTELLLIGIVALIVIGPKDLPDMFRTLGRFTAKARGMAREFSRAMEAAADESGVKDMANDIRKAADMPKSGLDTVKDAARKFEQWDPLKAQAAAKPAATPRTAAPTTAAPGAAAPAGPAPDPGAVEPPPPAAPAAAPARPHGPATQALAEAQAAKRKAASEAAAARRAARAAPPPEADA